MPVFLLSDIKEAAAAGRVTHNGGPKYIGRLPTELREYVKMYRFACAVLLELSDQDFVRSEYYPEDDVKMDAYGIAISQELQEQFGIEGLVTWFVKLTVDKSFEGPEVIMASLHDPVHPLKRVGGTINVEFTRRNRS